MLLNNVYLPAGLQAELFDEVHEDVPLLQEVGQPLVDHEAFLGLVMDLLLKLCLVVHQVLQEHRVLGGGGVTQCNCNYMYLIGRCYEAEMCTILLLLR